MGADESSGPGDEDVSELVSFVNAGGDKSSYEGFELDMFKCWR